MENKITEKIAIVSTIAFVSTVVYVAGFSLSIDVNLFNYFSISDYIKFSVCWMPGYLIYPVVYVLFIEFERVVLKPRKTKDNILSSDAPSILKLVVKFSRYDTHIGLGIAFLAFVVLMVRSFLDTYRVDRFMLCQLGVFVFIVIWGLLAPLYVRKSSFIKENLRYWQQVILFMAIINIGIVFLYGLTTGSKKLDSVGKFSTANLEMIDETLNKEGSVIFALSQYIVFLEKKTKMVEIIPINQVKVITLSGRKVD